MVWQQIYDPFGNPVISTLMAAVPVVVMLAALAFFHVKAHLAALLALVPQADLRKLLVEEIKRQGKPYGLYFESVTGGYTTTRSQGLQAFTVMTLRIMRNFCRS